MMQFLGPVANLAGSWLQGKADANAANAKLKLTVASICFIHIMSRVSATSSVFFSYTYRMITIVALYSERAQG